VIKAVALGLTLVVTVLLTGCGILVTDEAPTGQIRVAAPTLLSEFSEVRALAPSPTRTLSLGKARRLARRSALEIRIPACDDDPLGRGFALDAHTIVADRDAVPGGGWVRVETESRRSTAVGAASAYRIGELGVIQVARRLPRNIGSAPNAGPGASVVVVTERDGKVRLLPGVIVDRVSGAPFGAKTNVLRLSSDVQEGDAGPVLDARGLIVGAVFGVDEGTSLGLALPVGALRGRAARRTVEGLDACD
jgi:serine protease DegQ